jgi:phosphatase NudJ
MSRKPIPTWYVAAVVVRHLDRFLLIQEPKRGTPWSLPAGRAERGESLVDAAIRETLEESGVRVRLTGLVRVEHTAERRRARIRAVFLGEPEGDTTPKAVPDEESLGASWVTLGELGRYPLRSPAVEELLRYVAAGGPVYPLDILQARDAPYLLAGQSPNEPSPLANRTRRRDSAIVRAARWLRDAVAAEDLDTDS